MKRSLLTFVLIFSVTAVAQEKTNLPLPDSGNVTLTLDEYNRLAALAAKPVTKPDVPPLPYVIKSADMRFRVADVSVLGTVQIEGETFRKGETIVPLSSGLTILDAHLGGKALPLQHEGGKQTAILPGPAEFSVTLEAGLPLEIGAGRASFNLPVPPAGSARFTLVVPGDHTNVTLNSGLIVGRKSENGQTTIEAVLVPGQPTMIQWTTRETAAPSAPREVRFLSDVKTLVTVSEADLRIAALADITVVQGEPSQFTLEVPAGFEITGATGATLESSEMQSGTLVLKVSETTQRSHEFLISMERPINGSKADAPFLSFQGTQRETGEVLVEGEGTMELTATEGGGLKRMDLKEANPYLRSLARFPLQAAFRFHRQPNESPALALAWVRFPDSSVLAAIAERAVVTTLVTSEGKSLTEVKLSLRNQAQPFLKVGLPAGASILSADVAGEKVKPVRGPDGDRVPLLRPGFRPVGTYTVSFVFLHSGAPFAKNGGSELSLPKMDVPISLLQWEVFLPERFKVRDFGGDALAASLLPSAYEWGAISERETATGNSEALTSVTDFKASPLHPGQLGGLVVDQTGAVIPGATVTVRSLETGATRTTATNQSGLWVVSNTPSGRVRVTVELKGFKSYVIDTYFDANRPEPYASTLSVSGSTEAITIEAHADLVPLGDLERAQKEAKKNAEAQQRAASSNVLNLQQRIAGVLPVAVDVPRAGNSYRFVRPLVLDEETKVTFTYKTK
jgi:hypothetical protein